MFMRSVAGVVSVGKLRVKLSNLGSVVNRVKPSQQKMSITLIRLVLLGMAISMTMTDLCRMVNTICLVSGCVSIGIALTLNTLHHSTERK